MSKELYEQFPLFHIIYQNDTLMERFHDHMEECSKVAALGGTVASTQKTYDPGYFNSFVEAMQEKVIAAALFHDCGKNVPLDSPYLEGFTMPEGEGKVPPSVVHQYVGAYIAENKFGVTDEDGLNAVRYHTSARENMSELEKLIFLADMLEEARSYEGVDLLRKLFWRGQGLDECLERALFETLEFLKKKNAEIYPLTRKAYEFYKK